jgi:hypothetical protein
MLVGTSRGVVLTSTAVLTESQSLSAGTVSSGSVTLALTHGATEGSWLGAVSLVPGASDYARLTVVNAGGVELRYSATALSSSPLSASLVMTIATLAPGTTTCSAATFSAGTVVSDPSLPFGTTPADLVIGDPAPGAQAGDRVLAAKTSEELCLKVSLPLGTGLGHVARGTTATTSFTFSAENT